MSFNVRWHPKARKFLRRLPTELSKRIIKKIKEIKENPFRYIEHYEGKYYKLRIGDFRLLLDIDFKNKIFLIEVLDKRGRVYKR
jgi:mRNA interferase RelE/StbE